ncbi:MAG: hypothetical protein ACE5GV_18310 [Candidatus Scalindua sp.]
MEDNKKKIIVVARAGGIEIVVESTRIEDAYTLVLSKPRATELALNILNTIYKTGAKL